MGQNMREGDLLRRIYAGNSDLPQRVTLPPGDDMGAVRLLGDEVLAAVDQLAESVHVDLSNTPLEKVGRKAVTRNLSDIAAMGAKPTATLAAACLPRGFAQPSAERLLEAMRQTAMTYDCPLIGGDVSLWDGPMLLSVTVLAEPAGLAPLLRVGSQPGDWVCLSGDLGGSLQPMPQPDGRPYVHHLDFQPRLELGRALAAHERLRPRAMIDLSDGLGKDLGHLCGQGLRAVLELDRLPISPRAREAARHSGRAPWEHALGDGEDYELCFSLPGDLSPEEIPQAIDGVAIRVVGRFERAEPDRGRPAGVALRSDDGSLQSLEGLGWEHQGDYHENP
jgi:thiamine-monophosphate kinase